MSRRLRLRTAVLFLLAAVVLGLFGAVAWHWIDDYRLYRRGIESLALPGQEPKGSIEEFLRYRRALDFYDAAERLAERNATAEEVRKVLGEPDHVSRHERYGLASWFYPGTVFRERRQPTLVVGIDLETSRVTSVQHIVHD